MPETGFNTVAGTVLAFDFGEKRIGVAVGELSLRQAHPLTVISHETRDARFAALAALIDEWRPVRLIVGLPADQDGAAHAMSRRCARFGNQLNGRFNLPVDFIDERFTSAEAADLLRAAGHRTHKAKPHLDAVAAQVILQSYFDARPPAPLFVLPCSDSPAASDAFHPFS